MGAGQVRVVDLELLGARHDRDAPHFVERPAVEVTLDDLHRFRRQLLRSQPWGSHNTATECPRRANSRVSCRPC